MRRLGLIVCLALIAMAVAVPSPAQALDPRHHPIPTIPGTTVNWGPSHADTTPIYARVYARAGTNTTIAPKPIDTNQFFCTVDLPTTQICVWYTTSGSNAATQQFAQQVLGTFETVAKKYINAGYKPVEHDPTTTNRMNVYLQNVTPDGYYGYTTPSSTDGQTHGGWDRAAFMVIDNDFQGYADPYSPTQLMQVTVAHEFFHAVQFAYDAFEDPWFMESTATWAETQVFAIMDNRYYLAASQGVIGTPWTPLDDNIGGTSGLSVYQDYLFWQYLGEHVGGKIGGMPAVVLSTWKYANATGGQPTYYSSTALSKALAGQKTTLWMQWRQFSWANRQPAAHYANGRLYPASKAAWSRIVKPGSTGSSSLSRSIHHLSSHTLALKPQQLPGWRLRVVLSTARPSVIGAVAVVFYTNGTKGVYGLNISGGRVTSSLPFSSSSVSRVDITISNSVALFNSCYTQSPGFSCQGKPSVDNVGVSASLTPYRP